MDINLKKRITVLEDELFTGVGNEIVPSNDYQSSTGTGVLLDKVNLPTDSIILGKIKRIDVIPFVHNNVPDYIFDIRSYFDRGIPEEIRLEMVIWFQEYNDVTLEMEIFSLKKKLLLYDTEFILDLIDIKDKVIKIDFRMGTKFYNVRDHFFKSFNLELLESSKYLYDYKIQEIPFGIFELQNPTTLPLHLQGKTSKLQESLNVYRVPDINSIPLVELAEKIYIYDVPYVPGMEASSLDSVLVPEFQAGITKYLNNTRNLTKGEEQIFIRYPVDVEESTFRFYIFINDNFYEITKDKEVVSSAYRVLSSLTRVSLMEFSEKVFELSQDIYSIDIASMHLCFIKYRSLSQEELNVRYFSTSVCIPRPMNAGEIGYSSPVLNLSGNSQTLVGNLSVFSGAMGGTYYFAEQLP